MLSCPSAVSAAGLHSWTMRRSRSEVKDSANVPRLPRLTPRVTDHWQQQPAFLLAFATRDNADLRAQNERLERTLGKARLIPQLEQHVLHLEERNAALCEELDQTTEALSDARRKAMVAMRDCDKLRDKLARADAGLQEARDEPGKPRGREPLNAEHQRHVDAAVDAGVQSSTRGGQPVGAVSSSSRGIPGWSLESWMGSLCLEQLISKALTTRLRKALASAGAAAESHETAELEHLCTLVSQGSVDTIVGLLTESSVLNRIAEAVHSNAKQLAFVRAREAGEPLKSHGGRENASGARKAAASHPPSHQHKSHFVQVRHVNLRSAVHAVSWATTATDLVARFNANAGGSGGRTIFFHKDVSLYADGLSRLVGTPMQADAPYEAMQREHTGGDDADVAFAAPSYQLRTTSRVEWSFVAEPAALPALAPHLVALGLPQASWPSGPHSPARTPRTFEDFAPVRKQLDARLAAEGAAPLSLSEFCAVRLYSGPLYVKYNVVLRSAEAPRARQLHAELLEHANSMLEGNRYPTTIHVLSAAIMKLARINSSRNVYRAPGANLPPDFFDAASNGTIGIIEPGCLSTSSSKEEAIEYARRSGAKVVFEIQRMPPGPQTLALPSAPE
jgi:hypothetical protein